MTTHKEIFDAVRKMLGRGFQQHEVKALDAAIAAALRPDPPSAPERPASPTSFNPSEVSDDGLNLIMEFEGCARVRDDGKIEAYQCPAGVWTIGWGATGSDIGPGTVWTRAQADARLVEDVARHARDVARAIGNAPTSQAQFDALVSFHYNTGAIHSATLTRKHKAGDYAGATNEFARWNKAAGRVMAGLTRRRTAEARLYRSGK